MMMMFSSSALGLSFLPQIISSTSDGSSSSSSSTSSLSNVSSFTLFYRRSPIQRLSTSSCCPVKISVSDNTETKGGGPQEDSFDAISDEQARISADWKAARAYKESGAVYDGRVTGFNSGGLLVRFYKLLGFLPYPQLSPSHSCKEPHKPVQEIAKGLVGSLISVKVILTNEQKRSLILSEKEVVWSRFSGQIKIGDVCEGRVGYVDDYGAFVYLRLPDGLYHLTGFIHISEVSWDLVQDARDILNEGDSVRVKVIDKDRVKMRIKLSMKQLEDDPLLETLDKVIPQDSESGLSGLKIEPLPGLDTICKELLQEDGISDVQICRQGFEKRVVSPDLQLWLSNAPAINNQFILLARAGRQVQEVHLTTTLDQEGIKMALQRVLERVP